MTRVPLVLAVLLAAGAFAGGYLLRHTPPVDMPGGGTLVLAQGQPSPSPVPSPRGTRDSGQREPRDRGQLTGTVESINGRTLVIKVSSARGMKADQGAALSVQVDAAAVVMREVPLTDVKRGQSVTLRGSVVDGKFVARQVIVEQQ